MDDKGEPLRKPWPSSAPPLLLRAGVPGPPLPLLLLVGLMCKPSRARALTKRRSLWRRANSLMEGFMLSLNEGRKVKACRLQF